MEGKTDFLRDQFLNAGIKLNHKTRKVTQVILNFQNQILNYFIIIYFYLFIDPLLPENIKMINSKYFFKLSIKQILLRATTQ